MTDKYSSLALNSALAGQLNTKVIRKYANNYIIVFLNHSFCHSPDAAWLRLQSSLSFFSFHVWLFISVNNDPLKI